MPPQVERVENVNQETTKYDSQVISFTEHENLTP